MDGMTPEMMAMAQQMMSDPEVMQLMQKPGMMAKIQAMMTNPAEAMQYQNDPDFQRLVAKMQNMQGGMGGGMGGMGGGMGGMGGGMGGYGGQASHGASGTVESKIQSITTAFQFESLLSSADKKPVCVDYTATWCGPCQRIGPVFHELCNSYGSRAIFVKVDGDQAKAFCQQQGIKGFPTFQFYVKSQKVVEFSGADEARLRSTVEQLVAEAELAPPCPYKHFPLKDSETVSYFVVQWDKVLPKLLEVTDEKEKGHVTELVNKLKNKYGYHTNPLTEHEYQLIDSLLRVPESSINNPLNLLRMTLGHPHAAKVYAARTADSPTDIIKRLCELATKSEKEVTKTLALQCLCNFFSRRILAKALAARYEEVVDALAPLLLSSDKRLKTSAVAVLINLAILFEESPKEYEAAKVHCLTNLIEFLTAEADLELIYRGLVIVGTLIYRDPSCAEIASSLEVPELVTQIAQKHSGSANITACVSELKKEFAAKPSS